MSRLPDLSEDRGDGRSRVYTVRIEVRTDLQRDGDVYVATAQRVGLLGYQAAPWAVSSTADTLAEAVEEVAALSGCTVLRGAQ